MADYNLITITPKVIFISSKIESTDCLYTIDY